MKFFEKLILFMCLILGSQSWALSDVFLSKTDYDKKELELITYSEGLILWRQKLNSHFEKMAQTTRDNNGTIDPRELKDLRQLVGEFHDIHAPRFKSFQDIKPDLLDGDHIISLTSKKSRIEKKLRFSSFEQRERRRRGMRFSKKKVLSFDINPVDELGERFLKHFRLQLTAKLVWLESYTLGFAPFFETGVFRQVLIRDLEQEADTIKLESFWFDYMEDVVKSQSLSKALKTYRKFAKRQASESEGFYLNKYDKYHHSVMNAMITKNAVVEELERFSGGDNFFQSMFRNMSFMAKRRWDGYRKFGVASLYEGSKIFGNSVGLVQTRHGFMYTWDKAQEKEITDKLKALDVLFEKTPFRLTDRFIPGFFGHNAIWSGSEEELKELGVWEHLNEEFQKGVREGRRVIEALRPGVQFNTFRHFMDIDDFAAMRMRDCEEGESPWKDGKDSIDCLNKALKKEYLIAAFDQVGKDYDFAFDVNTEETIVCSELLYRTFLDVDFETTLTVGMHNISPDQVAKKGINGPFEYFIFINEGEYVEGNSSDLAERILSLMR